MLFDITYLVLLSVSAVAIALVHLLLAAAPSRVVDDTVTDATLIKVGLLRTSKRNNIVPVNN